MKEYLSSLLLVLVQGVVFSQSSFELLIHNNTDNYSYTTCEQNGVFYAATNNKVGDSCYIMLYKISGNGVVSDSNCMDSPVRFSEAYALLSYNDTIVLVAGERFNDSIRLVFYKIDENLNIVFKKKLELEFKGVVFYYKAVYKDATAFYLSLSYLMVPVPDFNSSMYKISWEGHCLNKNYFEQFSIIELNDFSYNAQEDSIYVTAGISGSLGYQSHLLVLNNSLAVQKNYVISDSVERNNIIVNSNKMIISGRHYVIDWLSGCVEKDMGFIVMDTAMNILDFERIGSPDTVDLPASNTHTVYNIDSTKLLFSYTKNLKQLSTFANIPTWIAAGAFDSNMNLLWLYFYGNELNYVVFNIIATSDGGALINATQYDWNTQTNERDALLLKLNSDGLLTSTPENPALQPHHAIVYPNPGHGVLKVEAGPQIFGATFELFDVSGQRVVQQPIQTSVTAINTAALASGVYPWRIIWKGEVVEEGKWVKE